MPVFVPTLSRFSRNLGKLMLIIEYLLARGVPILTTNYLLRAGDAWVRRGQLVMPDNAHPVAGLAVMRGLIGVHREIARQVASDLG